MTIITTEILSAVGVFKENPNAINEDALNLLMNREKQYRETFIAEVLPTLTVQQLFNLTFALMKNGVTKYSNTDLLRTSDNITSELYAIVANQISYDPDKHKLTDAMTSLNTIAYFGLMREYHTEDFSKLNHDQRHDKLLAAVKNGINFKLKGHAIGDDLSNDIIDQSIAKGCEIDTLAKTLASMPAPASLGNIGNNNVNLVSYNKEKDRKLQEQALAKLATCGMTQTAGGGGASHDINSEDTINKFLNDKEFWRQLTEGWRGFPDGIIEMRESISKDGFNISALKGIAQRKLLKDNSSGFLSGFLKGKRSEKTLEFYRIVKDAESIDDISQGIERLRKEKPGEHRVASPKPAS